MRKTKSTLAAAWALVCVLLVGAAMAEYNALPGEELVQNEESKSLPGSFLILKTEQSNPLPIAFFLIFLPPKTLTGPDISGITETTAVLSTTLDKNGTGYYLVRPSDEDEPTVELILAGNSLSMRANTLVTQPITGLTASTPYKLYFVAKGTSGRIQSSVQSVAFTTSDIASYTVTPSAGANGSISPAIPQSVNHGSTTSFTVTPDPAYTASVGGTCGGTLVGTTYTTNAITSPCTVEASFFLYTQELNDTGLTWSGNYPSGNNATCTGGETVTAQDCSHGRDVSHNDNTDGHAGFSFTKISNSGEELPSNATLGGGADDWACTRDNVTGLIWEVKTDDNGLRDKDHRYTWYNSDSATNGGANGAENGGTCYETGRCDTEKYVADVKTAGLCGYSDWRMPTVGELESLVAYDRTNPAIDTAYFPNTSAVSVVWSGSPYAVNDSYNAWLVHFGYGFSNDYGRNYLNQVWLVRGGQ